MIAAGDFARHEETWLLLPWLANGRISPDDREKAEEHVRRCPACSEELAFQRLMCKALAEPDRVTYAPGPSFRKLLERIDNAPAQNPREIAKQSNRVSTPTAARARSARTAAAALWRPPGLAWAASVVLAIGFAGVIATAYRWSAPSYTTRSDPAETKPNVLHIAFRRSLTIGEVEQLLQSAGARVVEGPDSTGIFGVTPVTTVQGHGSATNITHDMHVLSARLSADPRVRWIEPKEFGNPPASGQDSRGP